MFKRVFAAVLLTAVTFSSSAYTADKKPVTEGEKFSYTIGMDIATGLKQMKGFNADVDMIVKGLQDATSGKKLDLTEKQVHAVKQSVFKRLRQQAKNKNQSAAPTAGSAAEDKQFSYTIGMDVARGLKNIKGVQTSVGMIVQAIKDLTSGKEAALLKEEALAVKKTVYTRLQAAIKKERKELGSANLTKGQEFLLSNKKKKGVKSTASGLQYMVLKEASGPKPTIEDTVTVNYRGTLLDGTEFDSSYNRNKPISFPLKGVIKGWTEGVQLMNVGSKYKLFIPSDLAYGPKGAGRGRIGPNETLIFEIELLSIKDK